MSLSTRSGAIIILLLGWVIITANYIGKPVPIDNTTNSGKIKLVSTYHRMV